MAEKKTSVKLMEFLSAIDNGDTVPLDFMEVPTLDEMEMEVPLLEQTLRRQRVSEQDEAEFEMQCILGFDHDTGVSQVSLY